MYANPFGRDGASRVFTPANAQVGQLTAHGLEVYTWNLTADTIASVLVYTVLLCGLFAATLVRTPLPRGSATLILTFNVAAMTLMRDHLISTGPLPMIGAALIAGLFGDFVLIKRRPSVERPGGLRMLSTLLPLILFGYYFAATALFGYGLAWSIHLIAGTIVLAAATGWAVASLALSAAPRQP
jgi:hypothetical protein